MKNPLYDIAYKKLKFLEKDEDIIQETMLKLHINIDKFDPSKSSIQTYVEMIYNTVKIDLWRKDKEKNTYPASNFEVENEEDGIFNYEMDYLESDELSPIDGMIVSEDRDILLNRIKMLKDSYVEVLIKYIEGKKVDDKTTLCRAKKALIEGSTKKYILLNKETKEQFTIDTYAEAEEITGVKASAISIAVIEDRAFGKRKWEIKKSY